jgi:hypothetical protein
MLISVVFVYSRFVEDPPIWSWETNPSFLRWFCHNWLSEQDCGKTHMKASKNLNNVVCEELLAHIRTIVVFLGGKLTYVFFYVTTELHQRRYVVIFWVFILFYCWWIYFIVYGLCRNISACGCLLLLFMRLFWLFVFSCRTLKWVWKYYWPMMGMIWAHKWWTLLMPYVKVANCCDPSSAGTLTRVKPIETCVESAFATICVRSVIAGCFLLFWWWRLGWVALHQVT